MWGHEARVFGISIHLKVWVFVDWVNVLLAVRGGDVSWEEPKVRRWRKNEGNGKTTDLASISC